MRSSHSSPWNALLNSSFLDRNRRSVGFSIAARQEEQAQEENWYAYFVVGWERELIGGLSFAASESESEYGSGGESDEDDSEETLPSKTTRKYYLRQLSSDESSFRTGHEEEHEDHDESEEAVRARFRGALPSRTAGDANSPISFQPSANVSARMFKSAASSRTRTRRASTTPELRTTVRSLPRSCSTWLNRPTTQTSTTRFLSRFRTTSSCSSSTAPVGTGRSRSLASSRPSATRLKSRLESSSAFLPSPNEFVDLTHSRR